MSINTVITVCCALTWSEANWLLMQKSRKSNYDGKECNLTMKTVSTSTSVMADYPNGLSY